MISHGWTLGISFGDKTPLGFILTDKKAIFSCRLLLLMNPRSRCMCLIISFVLDALISGTCSERASDRTVLFGCFNLRDLALLLIRLTNK